MKSLNKKHVLYVILSFTVTECGSWMKKEKKEGKKIGRQAPDYLIFVQAKIR